MSIKARLTLRLRLRLRRSRVRRRTLSACKTICMQRVACVRYVSKNLAKMPIAGTNLLLQQIRCLLGAADAGSDASHG
jgi:hypothetical protein